MRTLTDGTLTVQAFDANVWKQERNVLVVTDSEVQAVTLYRQAAQWQKLATYTLDDAGRVVIDLSDYIRTYQSGVLIIEDDDQNSVFVDYNVVGLINPASVLIPKNEMAIPVLFGLPSVCMRATPNVSTIFEMRGVPAGSGWEAGGYGGNFAEGSNEIPEAVVSFNYGDTAGNLGSAIFRPLECGKTYAAVRWVSFTGATRCHTWEVVRSKIETSGAFELETADGSYNIVKGRTDGFSLRLDGLNAYDYWYYSDVCQSSSVEVSLDGVTWQRVNVTTKGTTTPDGDAGKLNTLIVELNYRKYDAVSM